MFPGLRSVHFWGTMFRGSLKVACKGSRNPEEFHAAQECMVAAAGVVKSQHETEPSCNTFVVHEFKCSKSVVTSDV